VNRLRVVGYQVRLVAFSDDGDELTAVNAQPLEIPAAQWHEFVTSGLGQAIESVRVQIEGPDTEQPETAPKPRTVVSDRGDT
jgi:hypothetical protein